MPTALNGAGRRDELTERCSADAVPEICLFGMRRARVAHALLDAASFIILEAARVKVGRRFGPATLEGSSWGFLDVGLAAFEWVSISTRCGAELTDAVGSGGAAGTRPGRIPYRCREATARGRIRL